MLSIPFVSRRCKKSFIVLSSKLWNSLTDDIINLPFDQFRKRIRKNDIFQVMRDNNVIEIVQV